MEAASGHASSEAIERAFVDLAEHGRRVTRLVYYENERCKPFKCELMVGDDVGATVRLMVPVFVVDGAEVEI